MSFPDPPPPFFPLPFAGGEGVGFWPQFPMNNEQNHSHSQFDYPSPHKRPKNSDDNAANSMTYPPVNPRTHLSNPPVNKGTTNIFFKTRMCSKFIIGTCRNGENCKFAHGDEDMRKPPDNWQELVSGRSEDRGTGNWDDDQRIIHRMKLCKKFYNGEECPYGDRCNFLHEDPSKFRNDAGRFRESSAISIGTTGPPVVTECGSDQPEVNKPVTGGLDAFRVNTKPVYWKTKLCTKFETTGQCPFGEKCHFAHGQAELQMSGGRAQGETGSASSISAKPIPLPIIDISPANTGTEVFIKEEEQGKKCFAKFKGPKKINRIYADWLDDLPLVHSFPSKLET
ncbi:zinc finger CCCH domain-containing protein 39 [Malania oleifera]|uniref:zinc finger CCCH domain-containing protein 39 n=1 Tax=Malania oleifera TaxID=397392 RepID=UPI0025AEB775|nr:zinc finger CCCH domain-containing protein 39 [Malania oleifera]XP_057967189.1 zinc finger CCCH domain-containing protein 39 [Malania oleifera]